MYLFSVCLQIYKINRYIFYKIREFTVNIYAYII
ncbi:hypothetical protein NSB1T_04420 [Coprobacter fastidiosus NSB1 = JCM 33896]|nr:hypothetical protein NSB1T_04420 [Coprobacter fastidiosus NSB1 = JCM 33896]